MEHTGIVHGHHAFDEDCTICRLQAENNRLTLENIALKTQLNVNTELLKKIQGLRRAGSAVFKLPRVV